MEFIQGSQIIFYTSQKYEAIYIRISKDLKISYKEIFLLCVSLGAKNNKKTKLEKRGREFRASYLNDEEVNLLYTILLNDSSVGKNIDSFDDPEKQVEMKKILEEYAEGGMDILVEEIFKERWNGVQLDEKYNTYSIDMLKYLIANLNAVPF